MAINTVMGNFIATTSQNLDNIEIIKGQLIFVKDKREFYLDLEGKRIPYQSIVVLETEDDRLDMLDPVEGFYYVQETNILWSYLDERWIKVGGAGGGSVRPEDNSISIDEDGYIKVKLSSKTGNKLSVISDTGEEGLFSSGASATSELENDSGFVSNQDPATTTGEGILVQMENTLKNKALDIQIMGTIKRTGNPTPDNMIEPDGVLDSEYTITVGGVNRVAALPNTQTYTLTFPSNLSDYLFGIMDCRDYIYYSQSLQAWRLRTLNYWVDIDGTTVWNYDSTEHYFYLNVSASEIKCQASVDDMPYIISDAYTSCPLSNLINYGITYDVTQERLIIRDDRFSTAADYQTWCGNNNYVIVVGLNETSSMVDEFTVASNTLRNQLDTLKSDLTLLTGGTTIAQYNSNDHADIYFKITGYTDTYNGRYEKVKNVGFKDLQGSPYENEALANEFDDLYKTTTPLSTFNAKTKNLGLENKTKLHYNGHYNTEEDLPEVLDSSVYDSYALAPYVLSDLKTNIDNLNNTIGSGRGYQIASGQVQTMIKTWINNFPEGYSDYVNGMGYGYAANTNYLAGGHFAVFTSATSVSYHVAPVKVKTTDNYEYIIPIFKIAKSTSRAPRLIRISTSVNGPLKVVYKDGTSEVVTGTKFIDPSQDTYVYPMLNSISTLANRNYWRFLPYVNATAGGYFYGNCPDSSVAVQKYSGIVAAVQTVFENDYNVLETYDSISLSEYQIIDGNEDLVPMITSTKFIALDGNNLMDVNFKNKNVAKNDIFTVGNDKNIYYLDGNIYTQWNKNDEIYSSVEEKIIGTWNGEPLYRIVVDTTSPSTANTSASIYTITSDMNITKIGGMLYCSSNVKLPVNYYQDSSHSIATYQSSDTAISMSTSASDCLDKDVVLILEYTRTTS